MRTVFLSSFFVTSFVLGPLLAIGCMGRVEPGTGGGSSGAEGSSGSGSSGSVASSGSESSGSSTAGASGAGAGSSVSSGSGDPDCSALAVPDVARICPDGSSVGGTYILNDHQCVLEFPCPSTKPTGCVPGGACSPGTACASPGPSGCNGYCKCDATGTYQCAPCASPPPPTDSCSQGAPCSQGTGCGTAMASGGPSSGAPQPSCSTSCMCDPSGHMQCVTTCAPPPPPDPCAGYSLPNTCEICGDGTTQCEHFTVVDGQCAIEICPGMPVNPPIGGGIK